MTNNLLKAEIPVAARQTQLYENGIAVIEYGFNKEMVMHKNWISVLIISLILLVTGACSNPAAPKNINEVLISGPIVVDVQAHSVNIQAVSNIDVVCAVAYGPTSDYGQIATDDDMSGGGHSNHHPVLKGLRADTQYHYQLGGMGPDGTVYQSTDLTFKTLPENTGAKEIDNNLALLSKGARIVGVSSNYGGGDHDSTWGANHAIDGDPNTQWSTNGDGDNAWIEVELLTETHVTSIGLWTRTMGLSAQIFTFLVKTDRGEVVGPFSLKDADNTYTFDVNLTATRLRFEAVNTSGGNTGAVEIEVYSASFP